MSQRKLQKQATRTAIRDAALACFHQRGLARTSIQDITRQAGVAQGTFYVHFASKEAVAEALLEEFNDALAGKLAAIFDPGAMSHPRDFVAAAADTFLDHWESNRVFVRLYAEHAVGGLDVTRIRDGINPPMRNFLNGALTALAASRGVPDAPVELVTQGLLSLWLRLGLLCVLGNAGRKETHRVLVDMSLGALDAILPPAGGTPS